MVDALYLELHLGLQMQTSDDLAKWATVFDLLFVKEGFKLWWVHPNAARAPGASMHPVLNALPYPRGVWEAGKAPLAWEIALRRIDIPGAAAAKVAAPLACPRRAIATVPRRKEGAGS